MNEKELKELEELFNEADQLSNEGKWEMSITKWDEVIPLLPDRPQQSERVFQSRQRQTQHGQLRCRHRRLWQGFGNQLTRHGRV